MTGWLWKGKSWPQKRGALAHTYTDSQSFICPEVLAGKPLCFCFWFFYSVLSLLQSNKSLSCLLLSVSSNNTVLFVRGVTKGSEERSIKKYFIEDCFKKRHRFGCAWEMPSLLTQVLPIAFTNYSCTKSVCWKGVVGKVSFFFFLAKSTATVLVICRWLSFESLICSVLASVASDISGLGFSFGVQFTFISHHITSHHIHPLSCSSNQACSY